jgi:hypothetical protein
MASRFICAAWLIYRLNRDRRQCLSSRKFWITKPLLEPVLTYRWPDLGWLEAWFFLGDTAKGRIAYQDFFTAWKDADPDIPILKDAKAEYAKLN